MKKSGGFLVKDKVGQIWIETVLYTLIAFVMIGLVLAFARPQIQKLQDKALIEQSITMMKEIESTILTIGCPGNKRLLELGIKKGDLKIDGENDKIIFEMESKHAYSEPGESIDDGSLIIHTEAGGNINIVTLTKDYSDTYDIQYNGVDGLEILSKSSVPYKLLITNEGDGIIDISVI